MAGVSSQEWVNLVLAITTLCGVLAALGTSYLNRQKLLETHDTLQRVESQTNGALDTVTKANVQLLAQKATPEELSAREPKVGALSNDQ